MKKYETVFIINPTLSEEETTGLVEKFKSTIESDGKIDNVDQWGKRGLAYEVNDFKEGYYVQINFEANPSLISNLERDYQLTEGIIRYLTICQQD